MYFVDIDKRTDGTWYSVCHFSEDGELIQDTPFLFEAKDSVQRICDFSNALYDSFKSTVNHHMEDSCL